MRILPLTYDNVRPVALAMRAIDREEILALHPHDDLDAVAINATQATRFGAVLADDRGNCIAAIGAAELWPGMFSVWFFATDAWRVIAYEASAWIKAVFCPMIIKAGGRRAECQSLATHRTAHRWLQWLGFEREATLPRYGKHGEDFFQFVRFGNV